MRGSLLTRSHENGGFAFEVFSRTKCAQAQFQMDVHKLPPKANFYSGLLKRDLRRLITPTCRREFNYCLLPPRLRVFFSFIIFFTEIFLGGG